MRPNLKISSLSFPCRTSESFKIWRGWNTGQREDPGWSQDSGSQWRVILPPEDVGWRLPSCHHWREILGHLMGTGKRCSHPTSSIHRGWASLLRNIHSERGTSYQAKHLSFTVASSYWQEKSKSPSLSLLGHHELMGRNGRIKQSLQTWLLPSSPSPSPTLLWKSSNQIHFPKESTGRERLQTEDLQPC